MAEMDICSVQSAWLEEKLSDPEASIEEFLREQYIYLHCDEEGTEAEKSRILFKRLEHWKMADEKYRALLEEYPDDLELEQWQASQMLDGIIDAFGMSLEEQYRYLLNVRLLCAYQLMGEDHGALRKTIEQDYEQRWGRAAAHVSEFEVQELFSNTVRTMQYAGLRYDDDTRYVLAQIGGARDADFSHIPPISALKDMQLITCFVVSEMVLGDESETYSEEERDLLLNEVIPVCACSAAVGAESENPVRTEKLAQSILAETASANFSQMVFTTATVMLAAKVVLNLLSILGAGISLAVGAGMLWKMCKEAKSQEAPVPVADICEICLREENDKENKENRWNNNEEKNEVMNYV